MPTPALLTRTSRWSSCSRKASSSAAIPAVVETSLGYFINPLVSVLLGVVVARLCRDPQALVEIYLNYDCDRSALENVYERLMNTISRLVQAPPPSTPSSTLT